MLRERANPEVFHILSARTQDLNGKRVLLLEGRYTEIQKDLYEVFIDADGTGRVVQEVYFLAPKIEYLHYLKAVKIAFSSIEWK
jgi:hypothetical protein